MVSYTIESVKRGLTPNPDMMCNKYIKFGCFEEKWGKDFDKIATGHYATTTEIDGEKAGRSSAGGRSGSEDRIFGGGSDRNRVSGSREQ